MTNENRQGYKKTKLGWIPVDWEVVKLGSLGRLTSGTTPLRANHTAFFQDGTFYWVKTTDLNNGIITDTEEKVTQTALDKTSLKLLPKNTLLIAMYGGFNQIGRTGLLNMPASINQALSALILIDKKVDPIYILNWMNHKVGFWKRFAASSRKDPNITKSDVSQFPFLKPSLPEQQKIATILTTWDKAIEKLGQLIKAKEEQKKALMQRLLTGKVRVKGFSGEWEEKRLGELTEIKSSKRVLQKDWKRKGVSFLRTREIISLANGEKFKTPIFISEELFSNLKKKYGVPQSGDLLVSGVGTIGEIYIVKESDEFYFKDGNVLWIKITNKINSVFLHYSFKSRFIRKQLMDNASITTVATFTIDGARKTKINLPEIEEQTAIASILTKAEEEIALLREKLTALKEQKKGLMQQLLTGKIRVKP